LKVLLPLLKGGIEGGFESGAGCPHPAQYWSFFRRVRTHCGTLNWKILLILSKKRIQMIKLTPIVLLFLIETAFCSQLPYQHQLIDDSLPRIAAQIDSNAHLPSNSVIDIVRHQQSLWLGTGRGLAQLHLDAGISGGGWSVIDDEEDIGRGGISALAVTDSIIWVATAYSEDTDYGVKPAGGGISYSLDGGDTWFWQPQPIDSLDDTGIIPNVTNIQNVTYDIALSDSAVWIVSYGGGLRKLPYGEEAWINRPPDDQPFDAYGNINHRCFSAAFYDGSLYIGTADGINRSDDEGETWTKYSHDPNNPRSLTGNFITALGIQETNTGHNIWAATWKAEKATEYYGVSVSSNRGQSWRVALSDSTILPTGDTLAVKYGQLKVHNFGFNGDTVYVAADKGLWRSYDGGMNWGEGPLQSIEDETIGESFEELDFFSVAQVRDSLFVGTDNGLFVGWWDNVNREYIWRAHKAHQPAGVRGNPTTYAYPNPFTPMRGDIVRFQIKVNSPTMVYYSIFNFAMEKVIDSEGMTVPGGGIGDMAGYGSVNWNGLDKSGKLVANGVYFYRIKVGSETHWGKVMVLD
jgi:ligand-binding sensor domain-containing protein